MYHCIRIQFLHIPIPPIEPTITSLHHRAPPRMMFSHEATSGLSLTPPSPVPVRQGQLEKGTTDHRKKHKPKKKKQGAPDLGPKGEGRKETCPPCPFARARAPLRVRNKCPPLLDRSRPMQQARSRRPGIRVVCVWLCEGGEGVARGLGRRCTTCLACRPSPPHSLHSLRSAPVNR